MSSNVQRSPMEDIGKEPKKKKSTTKNFQNIFKRSVNAAKNIFPSFGESSRGFPYLSGQIDRINRERAGEKVYEYYNIEQSFARLNAATDRQDPPILLEAEAQNLGLNAAPKSFDQIIHPYKTSIRDRREKIEEAVQYSSDEDTEVYDPSNIYRLSDYFNFSPTQMSNNSSLTFKRRSKTPTKAKDIFKEDALEELFPKAPFPRETKKLVSYRHLDVPPKLIDDFKSAPVEKEDISELDINDNFIPGLLTIERMTKPSFYDYDDSFILKKGDVQMKRMVLEYYMSFYAILFRDGLFLIYENSNAETPKFSYYLQCYEKIKDKKYFYINAVVRDSISYTALKFLFNDEKTRKEWLVPIKRLTKVLNSDVNMPSLTEKERQFENEFYIFCNECRSPDTLESYECLTVLGRGAFGKILHCRHKDSNRNCAMKVMRKDVIKEAHGVDSVIFQNHILRQYDHPCLQKLDYTIVNNNLVVFIIYFANGGCLEDYVFIEKFFSKPIAVYYGAQMASAVIYLHSKGVICRDLCLRNCYLDHLGNLKITDFGMSIGDSDKKAYNFHMLQNIYYVAPELLCMEPYGFSCDWWSFGVCFYHMLTGNRLFNGNSTTEIANNILNENLSFNSYKGIFEEFLNKILEKNPQRRLGCFNDEREILEHDIFKEIIWKKGNGLEIEPPILPNVETKDDYSLFKDSRIKCKCIQLTPFLTRKQYLFEDGNLKDLLIEWIN